MKYFSDCKTLDEAKTLFRKLTFKLHPDTSGYDSQQDFIKMYAQFKAFRPTVKRDSDQGFNAESFYNVIKKFDGLDGIQISFVGSFIWLEDLEPKEDYKLNATFIQKDLLKAIKIDGFNPVRYASKKQAWFFSPEGYKQKFKSKKNLDQIKNTYGCKTVQPDQKRRLK